MTSIIAGAVLGLLAPVSLALVGDEGDGKGSCTVKKECSSIVLTQKTDEGECGAASSCQKAAVLTAATQDCSKSADSCGKAVVQVSAQECAESKSCCQEGAVLTASDEGCTASKSACSDGTVLVAEEGKHHGSALPECPVAASEQLCQSFENARVQLVSLSDGDRLTITSAMHSAATTCPLGKRMEPTISFVSESVAHVHELHTQMAGSEELNHAPEDLRALLTQRARIVGAIHQVMDSQQAVMVSMMDQKAESCCDQAVEISISECQESCDKAVGVSTSDCQESCDKAVEVSTSECQESCDKAVEVSTSECQESCDKAVEVSTSDCQESCGKAVEVAASDCQESCDQIVAVAASDDCAQSCGDVVEVAASFCPQTWESGAAQLVSKGDGMLECWAEAPAELAAMCDESKAQLQTAMVSMHHINPAMAPMMQASGYYADALGKVVALDAKILEISAAHGQSCSTFQASCDLLAKAAEVAATMSGNLQKASAPVAVKSAH